MKYLFITLILLGLSTISAPAPDYLKDATIVVTLKDGTTYTFSANEYMVAKRDANPTIQLPEKPIILKDESKLKSTVKLYSGVGPSGNLNVESTPSTTIIRQETVFVFGLGFNQEINETFSLDVIGLSNKTAIFGVGYSF